MINNPTAISTLRAPRAIVTINGDPAQGLIEIEIDNNSYYQADTFRVSLSLAAQPPSRNWAWWASQTQIQLAAYVGFPANVNSYTTADLQQQIVGNVDDVDIDPVADRIYLTGRDLTSLFIDNQTYDKWPQQTSSRIASALAARRGLNAVITNTSTPAGRFYSQEHALETRRLTEWDLLSYLARQEDFSVFVRGTTLFFQPRPLPTDDPYVLQWTPPQPQSQAPIANAVHMKFRRNLTIARDVIVFVRSFDMKTGRSFTIERSALHPQRTPGNPAQKYFRYIPGLTREQALIRAQELLHEITLHEMLLEAELPADNVLTPQNIIKVQGTGTLSDQIYFPASIHRSFSYWQGYRMTIVAKNHATESEAVV